MRASRGMGAISQDKMPKAKTIVRKDNPNDVTMYAEGGMAGKKVIQDAIKKPGSLRKALGAKPGKPIPEKSLEKAAKAPGKLGQRARFAEVLKGFKK